MNVKSFLLSLAAAISQLILVQFASAELIAYESFSGMPINSGLNGSGANATGWTDSGWMNGNNPRYQTLDPIPDLFYQVAGGAFLDGANRAVQLTTNPEPVPTGLLASRTLPEQNTTIYFSFLVRPVSVGTGSDSLDFRISDSTGSLAVVAIQPEVGQQYFNLRLPLEGSGSGSGSGSQALHPSTTYLIAGRITRPSQSSITLETWINPPAAYPGSGSQSIQKNFFSPRPVFNSIGLGISSSDTGGPASTILFDELRVGYTWADIVPPARTTLGNISTRLRVETGDNVLIGGFIVTGNDPKKIIVRAIGPSLSSGGKLENPTLELYGSGGLIASNDNWIDAANKQEITNSTIPPTHNLESAILETVPADGSEYTAIVRGIADETGIALVEVYDLNRMADSKLANISTRGFVQTGDNVLIGGLIVGAGSGTGITRVLVRAIGPSLINAGVSGVLQNPTLELINASGVSIASNDDWMTTQKSEIEATTIPPTNDLESALIVTLAAGNYTAIVRGQDNTTGAGLVEVYDVQ